ncbi:MAG: urease accessory UreF family protein [Pseudomonadota bacterium]
MTDNALDLLRLTQWLSPAFPLGSFAYSHGLESFISAGEIGDAATFETWLVAILERGAGWNDGLLLSLTHRQAENDGHLAALAAALASSRERWEESLSQGSAFARTTNALLETDLPPLALPVAVGIQARQLRLETATVIALYLQSSASNLVSVATRAVPLGQTEAQAVLERMSPKIVKLAEHLATADAEAFAAATPRADWRAMVHETAEPRLFRS